MPVSVVVEPEIHVVKFECNGRIAFDDVRLAFEKMFVDPQFKPGIHALWDLRHASIAVRAQEIPDLLGMISARQQDRGRGYRVAIVVAGSPDFGLSTLFEMSAHSMPFDVRVFRSYTQATKWLGGEDV